MGRFIVACSLATVLTSCGTGAFQCTSDLECEPGSGGRCEPTGFCSFPDPECDSGYRYGDHSANGLAMLCVDPVPVASTGSGETTTSASGADSSGSTAATTVSLDDSSGGPTCVDWWDCAWPYRRAITLAPDAISETIDGLVVPVLLPDVSDATRFGPSGQDVRVVTTDGTVLPFDVEQWDPEGSGGTLWARLPTVDPQTPIPAYLYYGRPDASAGSNAVAAWADYAAVWHLTDLTDSTGRGPAPADEGSTPVDGRFGGGRLFDAPDQRLRIAPSPALADLPADGMTLVAITMPMSTGVNSGGRIFDNADATDATSGVTIMPSLQTMSIEVNRGASTSEAAWHGVEPMQYGSWNHLVVTLDDIDGATAFLDGTPVTWSIENPAVGMPLSDAMSDVGIGGAPYDATHTFDGVIDELRVIRGVRSEAWITAQYAVTLGGALSLGDEQTAPQ